jgi:hypothetical protein
VRHAVTRARLAAALWLRRRVASGTIGLSVDTGRLSIARVRLAFGSLLFMLLAGVLMLLHSALDRLEQERRLRHEVVAERVFDELERELNAHLERESARPSSAYDAPTSQVDAWAPYVVGYFTVAQDYRVLSGDQLTLARKARIHAALARVWPNPQRPATASGTRSASRKDDAPAAEPAHEASDLGLAKMKRAAGRELNKSLPSKSASEPPLDQSPEVLRRLNRGQETRQKRANSQSMQDPFGY